MVELVNQIHSFLVNKQDIQTFPNHLEFTVLSHALVTFLGPQLVVNSCYTVAQHTEAKAKAQSITILSNN